MGDEDRRVGLDRRGVVSGAKAAPELRSTIRVYRQEFLFDSRHPSRGAAWERYSSAYAGRLRDTDALVKQDPIRALAWELWIRRWNLVGEYKDPAVADSKADEHRAKGFEVKVVPRNSREEHRLRSYGIVRLA